MFLQRTQDLTAFLPSALLEPSIKSPRNLECGHIATVPNSPIQCLMAQRSTLYCIVLVTFQLSILFMAQDLEIFQKMLSVDTLLFQVELSLLPSDSMMQHCVSTDLLP